jgi:hypothetical protein
MKPVLPKPVPDPASAKETGSGWKILVGLALGFGVVLLAALGAVSVPGPGSLKLPINPDNSGI